MLTISQAEAMQVRGKGGLADYARNHPEEHNWSGKEIIRLKKEDFINQFCNPPQIAHVAPSSTDNLADILAAALNGKIQGTIDETTVSDIATAIIDRRLENFRPAIKEIEIHNIDADTTKNIGIQHYMFEKILRLAQLRMNTMLVGPAGSGKTTCCKNIAKALDLPFDYTAVCMQTTMSNIFGYMDIKGEYVKTPFYKCYKNGGVWLLDEIDAGNPNVLTSINAAIDNGVASFPTGLIQKHPDFICIAAANTFGFGGNIEYCGRNPMDAATKDRFKTISFGYDETLERSLAGNDSWTDRVQSIRSSIIELREKNVLASPRATIEGAALLKDGFFTHDEIENMCIFKGINPEVKSRILAKAGMN